ncbi:phage tail length tape measure family protein [Bordetella genomosp. 9]|uniref:Bacteriophage tail tape measure N-terminal domain-containing protein n=1 Tax=Bordetella genomosp. 9 TaxID=1416803 RepID=A0A1W6YZK0_9BORD|nr:phage tail length tape measure family protein [Bordetella genomosp. 9]ARP86299.1 hypothetical protein CAL13_08880 [Bordetella genomosp. 9]
MATAGSIVLDLLLRTGSFETDAQRASKAAEKNFKAMQKQAEASAAAITRAFTGIFAGALFGISAGSVFGKFIEETKNAQNEQAQLAAVLKSTGQAAGFTIAKLNQMASDLSSQSVFSEGDINRAQTRLLSYTGIVGETFPRAMQAVIDTAQRMGMTVEQAAETVGRALDIPSQGLSSLSKQGFRFTDEQKQLVEQLERTGKTAQAQAVVLEALESSYGGAAAAARETLAGALQALQNQIDDLMTGEDGSVDGLTRSINSLTETLGSDDTKQAFANFTSWLADMARQVVTAAGVINSSSLWGWLQVGGDEQDNPDRAIAELDEKIAKLQQLREDLDPGKSFTNKVNDVLFGDVADLDRQIAAAQSKRAALLVYQRNAPNPYAGVGETGAGTVTMPTVHTTASAPGKGNAGVDQGQKLIDQLQKQIALTGELTERQKLQIQIQQGYVSFQTQSQQDQALALADTLDFIKEQNDAYEQTQKTLQDLSKVDQDTTDQMGQFAIQAARNIQDSLGDGLYDLLTGNFDNIGKSWANTILKMVADAQAAQLGKALFGDYDKSGQIGGLIGKAFGSLFGGPSISPNQTGSLAGITNVGPATGSFDGLSYTGFADGGYTGPGGRNDVAGVVHAGEYVINADATRKLGLGFLNRLNGYANGGYVGNPPPASGGPNVQVNLTNQSSANIEATQSSARFDGERYIINVLLKDKMKNGPVSRAFAGGR